MATTNRERVGRALDLVMEGLGSFVDRAVKKQRVNPVNPAALRNFMDDPRIDRPVIQRDVTALVNVVLDKWNEVLLFRNTLGRRRHLLYELRDHRNRWAHQEPFSPDDAYRAVDTAHRLLQTISAEQARDVESLKSELLTARYQEQVQDERSRQSSIIRNEGRGPGPRHESPPRGSPEYRCPIPGCTKVFHGTRGGWDAHVASWRMHPHWHPDVTDGEERKRRFKGEYPRW